MTLTRITAAADVAPITLFVSGSLTASAVSRTLAGPVVLYGVPGRTSRGLLKVAPGALRFPDDLGRVKLTLEHQRDRSRGHLTQVTTTPEGIRAAFRVADGPEGDDALREAADRTRDGLSFDVVDAVIAGDTITDALVIAVGQVGIPAYDESRIDQIAAAQPTEERPAMLTEEQRARLKALRAQEKRTAEEETELTDLMGLAADEATAPEDEEGEKPPAPEAQASVAASVPAVPSGVPHRRPTTTRPRRENALADFVSTVTAAFGSGGGGVAAITAALKDVTNSDNPSVDPPAWSGELWSGLQYEPEWTPLFNSGTLTNWEGKGWRWVTKPEIEDYAGDKAEIPSEDISTEPSGYEAARMAVGHDFDRKFFDFPSSGFLEAYMAAVRESWAVKLDAKVRAYVLANAVAYGAASDSFLKAAAVALFGVKANTRSRGTFVAVNDSDYLSLLDINASDVPAFLEQFNVLPQNFIFDPAIPQGTVIAGVKNAATVRTLPGSPIRVEAQNLTRAGVDEAFFGYWAIEEHHTKGIVKTTFAVAP